MTASFAFGYTYLPTGQRHEWWHVRGEGVRRLVQITYDPAWFTAQGSINDLKQMAIEAASKEG